MKNKIGQEYDPDFFDEDWFLHCPVCRNTLDNVQRYMRGLTSIAKARCNTCKRDLRIESVSDKATAKAHDDWQQMLKELEIERKQSNSSST